MKARANKPISNLLELENISFVRNGKKIIDGLSLQILKGESWAILGKNGSGKTTLLNIIYGLTWPTTGSVKIFGKEFGDFPIREIQKKIGILQSSHQEERIQKNLSVKEIIATGFFSSIGLYSKITRLQKSQIGKILKDHGLEKKLNENFSNLSSGEKKLVLLLRSIISNPEILILDEPLSSFDISAREKFSAILKKLRTKKKFTLLLVTHRVEEIPDFITHAALMKNGKILAKGKIGEVLTNENLSKTYSIGLEVIHSKGRFSLFPSNRNIR